MNSVTIPLSRREKSRLSRLALRYGLSLPELSRHILAEIASGIPEESLRDYENPKELRASLDRGFRDWKNGRVTNRLR